MKERLILEQTQSWEESETGFPEPTMITIDEQTDLNKIHEQAQPLDSTSPKMRRVLIGLKVFRSEVEFELWQKEAPREILEITPTICFDGRSGIRHRIFVTYANGIIE